MYTDQFTGSEETAKVMRTLEGFLDAAGWFGTKAHLFGNDQRAVVLTRPHYVPQDGVVPIPPSLHMHIFCENMASPQETWLCRIRAALAGDDMILGQARTIEGLISNGPDVSVVAELYMVALAKAQQYADKLETTRDAEALRGMARRCPTSVHGWDQGLRG